MSRAVSAGFPLLPVHPQLLGAAQGRHLAGRFLPIPGHLKVQVLPDNFLEVVPLVPRPNRRQ